MHEGKQSQIIQLQLCSAHKGLSVDSPKIKRLSIHANLEAARLPIDQKPCRVFKSICSDESEANKMLLALAQQERRVLELRDDLRKAESELNQLRLRVGSSGISTHKEDMAMTPLNSTISIKIATQLNEDPLIRLAEGMRGSFSAIWTDIRSATIGTEATTTKNTALNDNHAHKIDFIPAPRHKRACRRSLSGDNYSNTTNTSSSRTSLR